MVSATQTKNLACENSRERGETSVFAGNTTQVSIKGCLLKKKIFLSQTTEQDLFQPSFISK